jgi:pilus assembly protein Flp/PilA
MNLLAHEFIMEFTMKTLFMQLIQDETGATAIEYAVIASVISVFCLSVPQLIGTKMNMKFTAIADALN